MNAESKIFRSILRCMACGGARQRDNETTRRQQREDNNDWRGLAADAADVGCRGLVKQLEAKGMWTANLIGDGIIRFSTLDGCGI